MSDALQPCKHPRIQTWRFEDTGEVSGLWSCVECGRKFEPVALTAPPAPAVPADVLRDAMRYRWLKAGRLMRQGHDTGVGKRVIQRDPLRAVMSFGYWCSPETLDAEIDAAAQAAPQPTPTAEKGQS